MALNVDGLEVVPVPVPVLEGVALALGAPVMAPVGDTDRV